MGTLDALTGAYLLRDLFVRPADYICLGLDISTLCLVHCRIVSAVALPVLMTLPKTRSTIGEACRA